MARLRFWGLAPLFMMELGCGRAAPAEECSLDAPEDNSVHFACEGTKGTVSYADGPTTGDALALMADGMRLGFGAGMSVHMLSMPAVADGYDVQHMLLTKPCTMEQTADFYVFASKPQGAAKVTLIVCSNGAGHASLDACKAALPLLSRLLAK